MTTPALPDPPASSGGWGPAKEILAALGVLVVVAALGWPLGRLWAELAPRVPIRKSAGSLYYGSSEPEQLMAGDGWFALLGVGLGVVLAVLVWELLRKGRGPWQVAALVIGSLVCTSLAYYVGYKVGWHQFERVRDTTADDVVFNGPLKLNITRQKAGHLWPPKPDGVLALQAVAAALVYTCLAGWSKFASLRGPDPVPPWYSTQLGYPVEGPPPPPDEPEQPEQPAQLGPGLTGRSESDAGTART